MAWAAATSSAFSLNTRLFLSSVACTSHGRPRFNGEAYSVFTSAAAGPSFPALGTPRQRCSPRRSFATKMASTSASSSSSSNGTASSSTAASHGLALPSNLPIPTDDGGAIHLVGHPLPACAPLQVVHPTSAPSTEEAEEDAPGQVDLFMRSITRPERDILVFVYPHTGKPNAPPGNGWDDVPGARGCTPELVAVQEGWAALQEQQARKGGKGREVQVYAMSGDEGEWQGEVSKRLGLGVSSQHGVLDQNDRPD